MFRTNFLRSIFASVLLFASGYSFSFGDLLSVNYEANGLIRYTAESNAQSKSILMQTRDATKLKSAVPGEYIIKFKNGMRRLKNNINLNTTTIQTIRNFSRSRQFSHIRIKPGANKRLTLARLKANPDIEYIEPNYIINLSAFPDDLRFDEQWGMHNTGTNTGTFGGYPNNDIDAVEAWDLVTNANNAVIAVIDSGVDYTHEDLSSNMYQNSLDCNGDGVDDDANGYVDDCYGIDTINGDSDPMDDNGHGTHVSGIIGASGNNGLGVTGVVWNTKILNCKFTDNTGAGTSASAIACFDYIASMKQAGVNIIATNNSWGSYSYSQAIRDVIVAQQQLGILTIAAAGNDGIIVDNDPSYPCAYKLPNVICVGAFNEFNNGIFNYGAATVHLTAPGVNILSTLPGDQYGAFDGTSMATPHVSGVAALLYSQDETRDWVTIRNLILSSAKRFQSIIFSNRYMMNGKLNANNAMNCIPSNSTNRVARIQPRERIIPYHSVGVPVTFSAYHIECANNAGSIDLTISPSGDLLTLLDNGLGQDEFAGDGIYTAVWAPTVSGTFYFEYPGSDLLVRITVDEHLEVGFPVKTLGLAGQYYGSYGLNPLVGNIDSDPELEILTTGLSIGPMYAWNHDGSLVDGWPQTFTDETGTYLDIRGAGYPSLAELDLSSPGYEVTVAYFDDAFVAYRGDGTVLPGWPVSFANSEALGVADYNGDGIDELFTGSRAYEADGSPLSGWPNYSEGTSGITPAFADLDNDGDLEVISVLSNGGVTAHHHDGTRVVGFPTITDKTQLWGLPVVGDVDGDGELEIMVTNSNSLAGTSVVYVVSVTGVLERQIDATGDYPYGAAISLADLDNDTFPEILLRTDTHMHIWKGDGSALPGWPVAAPAFVTSSFMSVVGDVDGDQSPDVVFFANSTLGALHVYNAQGVLNPLTPKRVGGAHSLAIADIDLDGRNEIITRGNLWNGSIEYLDTIWVYDLGGPIPHGKIEWGQIMGNVKRQGHYGPLPDFVPRNILTSYINGSGSLTSSSGQINCPTDCSGSYATNETETLTATPNANSIFDSWSGACAGQGAICTLNMATSLSTTANFSLAPPNTFSLTASVVGNGSISSNPAGIDCGTDCNEVYDEGTSISLSATAQTGFEFSSWTGACAGQANPCSISLNSAQSVGATFTALAPINYQLTVSPNGLGSITSAPAGINCGTDCTQMYVNGTSVQLTATPISGFTFSDWNGDCAGQANPCTIFMNNSFNVAATYSAVPVPNYSMLVNLNGSGEVISNPAGISCRVGIGGSSDCAEVYSQGTNVQLTATPASGYQFDSWGQACVGQGNPCNVTVTSSTSLTANFSQINNGGNAGGGGGGGCTLSATPNKTIVDPILPMLVMISIMGVYRKRFLS